MSLEFGKLDFAVSFNRLTAFPLDAKSYFESYAAAEAAAKTAQAAGSTETTYYFGQTVVVVEGTEANLYQIQPDGTLSSVGGDIAINSSVFETDEDGSLNLYGFADAVAGAQLVKGADGNLSWVLPDETTVEGLGTAVETLKSDVIDIREDITEITDSVSELESKVGDPANSELGTEATGLYAEIERLDNEKASLADINAAIAAADHLKRKIVDEYEDIQTYIDTYEDEDQYIFMVPNGLTDYDNKYAEYIVIDGVIEPVGTWEVDLDKYITEDELTSILTAYAKSVDIANEYVAKEEGKSLVSDDLIEKLENLESGENNFIKSVTSDFSVSNEGELSLNGSLLTEDQAERIDAIDLDENGQLVIQAAQVSNLSTWITENRDNVEGLISTAQVSKLDGIEEGAQKNLFQSVDANSFTITEDGVLTLNTIKVTQVEGLVNLSSKVSNLDIIINGDGTEANVGLVEEISVLKSTVGALDNTYVSINTFETLIGDIEELTNNNYNVVNEITALQEALRWNEINSTT